jgi:hypothetical protein
MRRRLSALYTFRRVCLEGCTKLDIIVMFVFSPVDKGVPKGSLDRLRISQANSLSTEIPIQCLKYSKSCL